jgi:hypothetical protein
LVTSCIAPVLRPRKTRGIHPALKLTLESEKTDGERQYRILAGKDPKHTKEARKGVSYFAQTPNGKRRSLIIIETPSQSVR